LSKNTKNSEELAN